MQLYIILLASFAVAWADVPSQHVGCENSPCQHQCVDTSDSYYCLCFENYDLHADQHSCIHKNTEALEMSYMGCWQDKAEHRDLPYNLWSRPDDATVGECMHDCRARGFTYAGLQNGYQCWCGNSGERAYNETGVCSSDCPGAPAQKCGGVESNSIYKVHRDARHMGCFNENFNDPDLPEIQWGTTQGKSVDNCISECGKQAYLFAGVFNGGQCACGNSFGKHGGADTVMCDVRCYNGWAADNCGGNATNAVYRVVLGQDLTSQFKSEEARAEVALNNLFQYPNLLGLYSQRMLIYASDTVNTIYDDVTCTLGDCYSVCGDISHPPGLDAQNADVTIRDFYLKLSDLPGRINYPDIAERVFVYVQTLYVDQSVDFPWSIYLHARQIIINYDFNPTITFDHLGPEFGVNIENAVVYGLPSDLTFQKLSLLCARMMISLADDNNNRIGWDIIDDLARGYAYSPEQQYFLDNIRTIRSEFTSIGRNNVHYVPYYTQEFYIESLDIYYDQITLYQEAFQRMVDSATDCQTFVDNAGEAIHIWTDTLISQAKMIRQYAETNLNVSAEVYKTVYTEYNASIERVDAAAIEFEKGIEKLQRQNTIRACFGMIASFGKLMTGRFPCGAAGVVLDLKKASDRLAHSLDLLEVTMENLAKTNSELKQFLDIADSIIASGAYQRYMDNVESVAALYVMIPEWDNFRYQIGVIFSDEEFIDIEGARGYHDAVLELCDWGEELTRSLTEYATHMRRYMATDSLVKSKEDMQQKYKDYLAGVQEDCDKLEATLIKFAEQQYDVMLDLNDQLIQLCQAMYFETMDECPESMRPNFAYDVPTLLLNINNAVFYASSYSRTSPAVISLEIQDDAGAWDNCTDLSICPVKMFRETRTLYYELPLDHPVFQGIDMFLVEEIQVYVEGATSTSSTRDDIRLLVSCSGPFYNRKNSEVAMFVTRALSHIKFQYDLTDGVYKCKCLRESIVTDGGGQKSRWLFIRADIRDGQSVTLEEQIEVYADLYRPSGAMIRNMTPFTIWIVEVDPAYTHIDISQVETIRMVFKGPFQV